MFSGKPQPKVSTWQKHSENESLKSAWKDNDIRSELGVEGLGLVPEKLTSQRKNLFDWNPSSVGGLSGQIPIQETNPHQQKKNLRQKRKVQRQNRKKARRR